MTEYYLGRELTNDFTSLIQIIEIDEEKWLPASQSRQK